MIKNIKFCITFIFYHRAVVKNINIWHFLLSYSNIVFVMQPLQNSPLCSNTVSSFCCFILAKEPRRRLIPSKIKTCETNDTIYTCILPVLREVRGGGVTVLIIERGETSSFFLIIAAVDWEWGRGWRVTLHFGAQLFYSRLIWVHPRPPCQLIQWQCPPFSFPFFSLYIRYSPAGGGGDNGGPKS